MMRLTESGAARDIISRSPALLQSVATMYVETGHPGAARSALEQALALAPRSPEVRASLLWLLIGVNEQAALSERLLAWEAELGADQRWHDLLASAYQTLSLPRLALERYLLPRAAHKHNDVLWAMNLSDALEQDGQTERAWRLRRELWARLRLGDSRSWLDQTGFDDMQRTAYVRLAMAADPSDRSLGLLRELLALDRPDAGQLSKNARALTAAWFQSQGNFDVERSWLWTRFAESVSRPAWGEIAAALSLNDIPEVGGLTERQGGRISPNELVEAYRRVHDLPAAQSVAFENQLSQRDNETTQQQLTEVALAHSDHAGGSATLRRDRLFDIRQYRLHGRQVIGTRKALSATLSQDQIEVRDRIEFGRPADQRSLALALQWRRHLSGMELGAGVYHGMARWAGLSGGYRTRLGDRFDGILNLDWRQPSDLSPALRVGGREHRIEAALSYALTGRDRFVINAKGMAFETQHGDRVGRGRGMQVTYGHQFRLDPSDLTLEAFWGSNRFRFDDAAVDQRLSRMLPDAASRPITARDFASDSARETGVRLSTNRRFASDYTRTARAYASAALLHNNVTGRGHDVELGIAATLLGADHLHVFLRSTSTAQAQTDVVRQVGISYRLHF